MQQTTFALLDLPFKTLKYYTIKNWELEKVMDWKVRVSRYQLLCMEGINKKILLYSTENCIQYPMINHNGREHKIEYVLGVLVVAQWLTNPTRNHEVVGSVLPLLSGLRIQRCRELWCRLQTWLGSRVAVARA